MKRASVRHIITVETSLDLVCRKILNELASEMPSTITVTKIEEESNGSQTSQDSQDMSDGATNLTSHSIQYQAATGANNPFTFIVFICDLLKRSVV